MKVKKKGIAICAGLLLFSLAGYLYGQARYKGPVSVQMVQSIRESGFEGSYLVARGDEILAMGAEGKTKDGRVLSDDSVIPINSLTKQFCGAAVYQLISEGKLSQEDDLSQFFPNCAYAKEVKIKHLLNMTSGIPDYVSDEVLGEKYGPLFQRAIREEIKYRILKYTLQSEPGEEFAYCNANYYLLGTIVEKLSGKPFETYIQEHFLGPANMKNTVFSFRSTVVKSEYDPVYTFSAGSMGSTVEDLYRWQKALYGNQFEGVRMAEIFGAVDRKYDMGLEYKDGVFRHSGHGYYCRSAMIYGADTQIQVILLGADNDRENSGLADQLYALAALAAESEAVP